MSKTKRSLTASTLIALAMLIGCSSSPEPDADGAPADRDLDEAAELAGASLKDADGEVEVCHKGQTLNISERALDAHIEHGDTEGPCDAAPEETSDIVDIDRGDDIGGGLADVDGDEGSSDEDGGDEGSSDEGGSDGGGDSLSDIGLLDGSEVLESLGDIELVDAPSDDLADGLAETRGDSLVEILGDDSLDDIDGLELTVDLDDGGAADDSSGDADSSQDTGDSDTDPGADIDGGPASGVLQPWNLDADGDGFGDPAVLVRAADRPPGYVGNGDDCDDADPAINPLAAEICDSIDNNCDGRVDVTHAQLVGEVSLAMVPARVVGEDLGDMVGMIMGSAGDIDGDGLDELIFGAPGESSAGGGAGAAYLVDALPIGDLSLDKAPAMLTGEVAADMAGSAVAGIGDWTGDGLPDLAVGAPGHNGDDGTDDGTEGALYIVSGAARGDIGLGQAHAKLLAEDHGDFVGAAVADAGDTDGDGLNDLIIGAVGDETGGDYAGAAYVLSQRVSGTVDIEDVAHKITGQREGDFLGAAVGGVGDLNGDGLADVAVGAFGRDDGGTEAGALYVFYGPVDGDRTIDQADVTIDGGPGELLGFSLDAAGDVNGDGLDDLIVGAPSYGAAGTAYIFYGPLAGHLDIAEADAVLVGERLADEAGTAVAGLGDMNRDGFDDIIVGAPGYDSVIGGNDAGAAYILFGPIAGEIDLGAADVKLLGQLPGDGAGVSVESAGDMDGDGRADALIGTLSYSTEGENLAGLAYLLPGAFVSERALGFPLYADRDGDGFGNLGEAMRACGPVEGLVRDGGDCDDTEAAVYPGAEELCDELDNDCDGEIDPDCDLDDTGLVDTDTGLGDTGAAGDDTGLGDTGAAGGDTGDGLVDADTGGGLSAGDTGGAGDSGEAGDTGAVIVGGIELCDGVDNDGDGEVDEGSAADARLWFMDSDGDGFGDADAGTYACEAPAGFVAESGDCDDADAGTSPLAEELCDGLDNNCDGAVDEDAIDALIWYTDADGDGYGSVDEGSFSCEPPEGYTADTGDCDDGDADIYPGADETCDGADNDCDGLADEDAIDPQTWWVDADGDGWAPRGAASVEACEQPEGYTDRPGRPGGPMWDCDDAAADINPEAEEVCDGVDNNCNRRIDGDDEVADAPTWYPDADGDGWGNSALPQVSCEAPGERWVSQDGDCFDHLAAANPGAEEVCDGRDQNCDGLIDNEAVDAATWYVDADRDGLGGDQSTQACRQPFGQVDNSDDCDDSDPTVRSGPTWYADLDGDGYGDPALSLQGCEAPEGYVDNADDCDDSSAEVLPGGAELCDGVDNNCDGAIDEDAIDAGTWYADLDGDGYGDADVSVAACEQPVNYVAGSEDCDDSSSAISPAATELCDGLDNDCDGSVDQGAADASTWYADGDGDGFGGGSTVTACEQPEGYTADASDCDDGDGASYPGAEELCDQVDNDCDGLVDDGAEGSAIWYADADGDGLGDPAAAESFCSAPGEGYAPNADDCDDSDPSVLDGPVWFADLDGDGHGASDQTMNACQQPEGYTAAADDCDDSDPAISPSAVEVCDGIDNDCDGEADEEGAEGAIGFFTDRDGDGYGDDSIAPVMACEASGSLVTEAGDCDDGDGATHPGAEEVCDERDNDCDGAIDEDATDMKSWYVDADGDGHGQDGEALLACEQPEGYAWRSDDCDDGEAAVYPEATELCDGLDNDCDGAIDEDDLRTYYQDADGDGDGDAAVSVEACEAPEGYIGNKRDCDDGDPTVYDGATEVCDGVDNNCDGVIDEDGAEGATRWYADADGDGYGHKWTMIEACEQPEGYIEDKQDCDDSDASINPDGVEWCDGVDNDCDGIKDNDDAADALTWFADADGDGYGSPDATALACEAPADYVDNTEDCDDGDSAIYPDAIEWCGDGVDNDCDGIDQSCGLWGNVVIGSGQALYGHEAGQKVGGRVAGAGDVNGDGYEDIVIGAVDWDDGADTPGAAYVAYGPAPELSADLEATDAVRLSGEAHGDDAGEGVAGLGDINGDGYDDLIVGAPRNDVAGSSSGSAYVVYGPVADNLGLAAADGIIRGYSAWGRLGHSVAGAGDVDGDGSPDILVGAWYESISGSKEGAAYLFYGAVSGETSAVDADARITGESGQDYLGTEVAGVGDMDGDGYDDVALGAYLDDEAGDGAGATYVLSGPVRGELPAASADVKLTGESANDQAGTSISGGDIDGDGYSDLLVGAPGADQGGGNSGSAYVLLGGALSGTLSLADADAELIGERSGDAAGTVVRLGDLNGDSYADVVVGAPGTSALSVDDGAVYVVYGPLSGTLDLGSADAVVAGEVKGEKIGQAMAIGEASGDGYSDLLLGVPANDDMGSSAGAVFVMGGGPLPVDE